VGSGLVSVWASVADGECLLARALIQELKGVNAPEWRTQVDLLLYKFLVVRATSDGLDAFLQLIRTNHWTSRLFLLSLPNPSCLRKCQPLT
jgi:hypothetical protein